jgi:hypothetical protein
MSSAAFIIFTLYMIPDPATTPINPRRQVLFALAVAAVYGTLQIMHVVFGLFIALAIVSLVRGICLHVYSTWFVRAPVEVPSLAPVAVPSFSHGSPTGELAPAK